MMKISDQEDSIAQESGGELEIVRQEAEASETDDPLLSEEDEEDVPLVPSPEQKTRRRSLITSSTENRRASLNFSITRDDDEEYSNTWGDTWKFIASVSLTALLLGPLAYSHSQHYTENIDPNRQFAVCSAALEWNLTDMMKSMTPDSRDSYCRPNISCRDCTSPLEPRSKNVSQWQGAHLRNIDIVTNQTSRIDVAFIGDSITEHWIGTDVGSYNKKNDKVAEVFTRFFTEKGGGKYQGLALGISGDKCNELLFRLQDGELPLDAGVFWILIGANDLGMGCGTDVVLAGVIANVEYVLQERPLATVVINSLLPSLVKDQKAHETPYILLTQWVNDRLECYAKSHSRVEFFNATGIFIRNDQVVGISDFVHPSGEGSEAWAAAIVEKLEKLL